MSGAAPSLPVSVNRTSLSAMTNGEHHKTPESNGIAPHINGIKFRTATEEVPLNGERNADLETEGQTQLPNGDCDERHHTSESVDANQKRPFERLYGFPVSNVLLSDL